MNCENKIQKGNERMVIEDVRIYEIYNGYSQVYI